MRATRLNSAERSDLLHLLGYAKRAARLAGEAIMPVYQEGGLAVENKSDGSPLTQADLLAHETICKVLEESGLPILSEESLVPFEQRCSWQRFWLVDPLDGTKNFIARNDEFTINIALIEHGHPVIGVVVAPALNQTWFASSGNGAWQTNNGVCVRLSALAPWPKESRMFTSCFHDVPESIEFGRLNNARHLIPSGASTKLARIAASEAEFYPRFAGTSEWDIAAGHAILDEAGGFLRTLAGDVPSYNKPSLRNPFFIAWRPPLAWGDIKLPSNLA